MDSFQDLPTEMQPDDDLKNNLQFEYYDGYYNDANHEEDNVKQPIQETYRSNNFDLSVFENEINNDDGILLIYNFFAQLDFFCFDVVMLN